MMSTWCLTKGTFLVGFVPSLLCLIITAWIFTISFKKLNSIRKNKKSKHTLNSGITYLNYISCALSVIVITLCTIQSFLCDIASVTELILSNLVTLAWIATPFTVLTILIMRVYRSFKGSMFEINKTQKLILMTLYIITTISGIYAIFVFIGESIYDEMNEIGSFYEEYYIFYYTQFISVIFYVATSLYGMYVFGEKMYKITKLRATSLKNLSQNNAQIKLTKKQNELLNTTSKYLSLSALAIFTTFFAVAVIWYAWELYGEYNQFWDEIIRQIVIMVYPIDCTINVICLYLQYSFATRYYNKYCACFGKCWGYFLTNKFERDMIKKRETMKQRHIEANSNELNVNIENMNTPQSEKQLNDGNTMNVTVMQHTPNSEENYTEPPIPIASNVYDANLGRNRVTTQTDGDTSQSENYDQHTELPSIYEEKIKGRNRVGTTTETDGDIDGDVKEEHEESGATVSRLDGKQMIECIDRFNGDDVDDVGGIEIIERNKTETKQSETASVIRKYDSTQL